MKYLSPEIARIAKNASKKSLIKKGVSCGIFQELGVESEKQHTRKEK